MTYTFVLQNVERPDSAAQNDATVNKVAANCDLGALNEADDSAVRAAINKLKPKGWYWYVAGENVLMFKTAKFVLKGKGSKLIMNGGHLGAYGSGKKDNRRRGPNRFYQVANFEEKASGRIVRHVNTHLIAKAFTTEKWRKKLHESSVTNLRNNLQKMKKAQPTWPIIVSGDMNTNATLNLGPGFKRVNLPASFGKQKYDHVYVYGKVKIDAITTIKTYSDHKGMKMRVQLL